MLPDELLHLYSLSCLIKLKLSRLFKNLNYYIL